MSLLLFFFFKSLSLLYFHCFWGDKIRSRFGRCACNADWYETAIKFIEHLSIHKPLDKLLWNNVVVVYLALLDFIRGLILFVRSGDLSTA